MTEVERCRLGAGLEASRVVTGLWQIADMERDGRVLDLEAVAESMAPYAEAGLTSFDMADHYGSAEIVAGRFWNRTAAPESSSSRNGSQPLAPGAARKSDRPSSEPLSG